MNENPWVSKMALDEMTARYEAARAAVARMNAALKEIADCDELGCDQCRRVANDAQEGVTNGLGGA